MIDNTPCYTVSDQTSIAHPTEQGQLESFQANRDNH